MDPENQWAVTTNLTEPQADHDGKDRLTGLTIYGCLMLAMGGMSALLVPFMLMSMAFAPQGAASAAQMAPAVAIYLFLAVALVTLGIGSMRARRWARTLILVLAWMWLVTGIFSLISMIAIIPKWSDMMAAQGQQMPPAAMNAMMAVMLAIMACIYILLPTVFILFYRRPDVKATCERRDPVVPWTDRCPMPVLSLSLMLGFATTSVIWSAGNGFVIPFFGLILKGAVGAILILGCSVLCGYLSWATYKMKPAAWWTTVGFFVVAGMSFTISFSIISMADLYREMNFPKDQIDMMEQSGALDLPTLIISVISFAALLGYLVWVKKYFNRSTDPVAALDTQS